MFANTQMMNLDVGGPVVSGSSIPSPYPNIGYVPDYLYRSFPGVINSSTIRNNMAAFGNMDESQFKTALRPGLPPFVGPYIPPTPVTRLTGTPIWQLGKVGTSPVGPISVHATIIRSFCVNPKAQENMFKNAKGQNVPIFGAILLYCLCNWSVAKTTGQKLSGAGSPGGQFLQATYGKQPVINTLLLAP